MKIGVEEKTLNSKERNKLDDSEFGLPKERKFPLNDKQHVLSAIRFFKYAKPSQRKELANNIMKAIKRFDMDVNINEDTLLSKYVKIAYTSENYLSLLTQNKNTMSIDRYIRLENSMIKEMNRIIGYPPVQYVDDKHYENNNLLNETFVDIKDYNKYVDNVETNHFLLAIYDDIINAVNKLDDVTHINEDVYKHTHITEIINLLSARKNLDHIGYLIRNIYVICNKKKSEKCYKCLLNTINLLIDSYLNKHDDYDEITYKDIDYIIYHLSCIESIDNVTKYLETENDDKYKIYIMYNDNDIDDETGLVSDRPELESFNNVSTDSLYDVLYEGLEIDANGNIKITINPNLSYMDQYSDAHKILVENYKNKNYNGMKTNLAFMFSLISKIERDSKYKSRDPELVKARAFAINDFKTYLAKLQSVDPKFDFVEYYKKSDTGKYIIKIPRSTIIGIKKLFKTVMM